MRVALQVVDCDVHGNQLWDVSEDRSEVMNANFTVLVALDQQEFAFSFIIIRVDSRDRHLLLDAHVIEFGHELMVARVWFEGWRRANDPDAHGATRVRSHQQRERMDEVDELDFVFVHEFVQKDHSFIIPDPHTHVLTAGGDQAQVVSITATDNVFLVTLGFTSFDHLGGRLRAHHLVHVDLDGAIPATSDDRVVIAAVADERNLTVVIVRLQLLIHNSRLQVKDLEIAMVAADDELAMVLVEDHLRDSRIPDFIVEDLFDDTDWLTRPSVPHLNILLTGYEDLQPFFTKDNSGNGLIIGELGLEGPRILKDSVVTGSDNQATMLGHGPNGLNLVRISHIERLKAAVVVDAP